MDPGKNYASIISSDNLALGMHLADLLAESIGDKGKVAAMYFANDFYVTNLRYEGFIARLRAKHPNVQWLPLSAMTDPNKGQEVAQAFLARFPDLNGMYASWSIPAMGAVTAARVNVVRLPTSRSSTRTSTRSSLSTWPRTTSSPHFLPASLRPGVAEAKIGALTLIGEKVPPYVVVPPLAGQACHAA